MNLAELLEKIDVARTYAEDGALFAAAARLRDAADVATTLGTAANNELKRMICEGERK